MTDSAVYDAFLSYNSGDRPLVLEVAEALNGRGCSCFLDQWYLLPGRNWVDALEKALAASRSVAVFLGPGDMGRWQQRERAWALDRQAADPQFPVIPVLLPGSNPPRDFLRLNTWIDLSGDARDAGQLDRLAAAIHGRSLPTGGQRESRVSVCPYRGLLYFREEDAEFFFGRDVYIQQLVQLVQRQTLVAVVGASGSGKSSVVRAGLVPQLRARKRRPVWEIVTVVPGAEPLKALADGLVPLIEPQLSGYDLLPKCRAAANDLANQTVWLTDLVAEALRRQQGTDRLLLIVDQWEELYTQCEDGAARQRFIQELLAATARPQSPLTVVLTVRDDFYGKLLADRQLLDQLQGGKLDLGPMTGDELREAIERPAQKVGLTFQEGLADRLLGDAREEPGRLPLLQFALEELWNRQRGGQLTHSDYERLGRLSGAIATRAEAVYDQLDAAEQAAAPGLFRRLVRAGSKTEDDTRRRADFRSLDEPSQRVARRLADERLLVTSRWEADGLASGDAGGETVEVAHEELLRRWGRLREWIGGDRKFLQWRGRLAPTLEQYRRDPASALLRHGALREARQFYPARKAELEDEERRFLGASVSAEQRRKLAAALAIAAVFLVILGAWGAVRRGQNREIVNGAIKNLPGAAPSNVAPLLENLRLLPHYASAQLQPLYDAEHNSEAKLRLAFGLIAVDAVKHVDDDVAQYVIDHVADAPADDSANLVQSLSRLSPRELLVQQLLERAGDVQEDRPRARYQIAALSCGDATGLSGLKINDGDPSKRTAFIREFPSWSFDLRQISESLPTIADAEIRSGLCLATGGVDSNSRSEADRQAMSDAMTQLYQEAADAGTHSAAAWALRQWKLEPPKIEPSTTESEREQWTREHNWYVNQLHMTMVRIPEGTYRVGSPQEGFNPPRQLAISEFRISAHEVTVAQCLKLLPSLAMGQIVQDAATPAGLLKPVSYVTWYDAVSFCNRLSEHEGLQRCYRIYNEERDKSESIVNAQVEFAPGADGYRLPTEWEWEIACRASTTTDFSFGDDEHSLDDYGWYVRNSSAAKPVGEKRCNPWGLFDMHGNLWEWCFDVVGSRRVFRGGCWGITAEDCRSDCRSWYSPEDRDYYVGLRVARSPSGRSSQAPVGKVAEPGAEAEGDRGQSGAEPAQPLRAAAEGGAEGIKNPAS